jgi:hypothetical protein
MPHASLDAAANKIVTLESVKVAKSLKSGDFKLSRAFQVIRDGWRGRVTSYGHGRPRNRLHSMKDYGLQVGTAGEPGVNNQ